MSMLRTAKLNSSAKACAQQLSADRNVVFFRICGCGLYRKLSTAEVSTALRPFYFSVHPDLFGRYPEQRAVNENSLKQLSAVLAAQHGKTRLPVTSLAFYLREKTQVKGSFKLVKITLSGNNVRQSVMTILNACQISTEYVDKISKPPPAAATRNRTSGYNSPFDEKDPFYTSFIMKEQVDSVKEMESLKNWVTKHHASAREKHESTKATRDHIKELSSSLCQQYQLKEIKWDSGWNVSHIRGSLQSFNALANQHADKMGTLKGRTIVLGQFTGVSLDGNVYLGNAEVRHNWLDLIKNVRQHDEALRTIPTYEKTLSTVLRDIKIKRRKFMPKVKAAEYCQQLRRLATALGDVHAAGGFPRTLPASLQQYEIVVEPEAGPLMISPTGQIITPASCPGEQLLSFMAAHLDETMENLTRYKINKHTERSLHGECVSRLGVLGLMKDDCVTPDRMIQCCQQLLQHAEALQPDMRGITLWVTSYYSVLSDGVMCIPWDWKW